MERGLRRQKGKMLNEMPDEMLDAGEKRGQMGMVGGSFASAILLKAAVRLLNDFAS